MKTPFGYCRSTRMNIWLPSVHLKKTGPTTDDASPPIMSPGFAVAKTLTINI